MDCRGLNSFFQLRTSCPESESVPNKRLFPPYWKEARNNAQVLMLCSSQIISALDSDVLFYQEYKKRRGGNQQPQTMPGTTDHISSLERLAWQQREGRVEEEKTGARESNELIPIRFQVNNKQTTNKKTQKYSLNQVTGNGNCDEEQQEQYNWMLKR